MASKIASFTSQFVNEDVNKLKEQALASARWQREYFSALKYAVDYSKFPLGVREEVPYRRFDCENVWMIRGADHMESDLMTFVEGVRAGKMGYLTAATGLGKSTTLLQRVVSTVGCKAVSLQPKDKFAKSLFDFLSKVTAGSGDDPLVSFLYLKKNFSMDLGDLTYMNAAAFLVCSLIMPGWLDQHGVGLIYIDEAHFDSDEYDILRCLTMAGVFGRRTVCFATATPPLGVSCEMYRKVRFVKDTFPRMEPTAKLKDTLAKTQLAGDKLRGSVLVFAVDNDHAKALHSYYESCDLDVTLHTTDNYTSEWFQIQQRFVTRPEGTRVLVTTTLFDYSVNLWIDVVINFKVAATLVSVGLGQPILRKLRAVPEETNVQREGRAGRFGLIARILEMESIPTKGDMDTSAQDIRRYCWFQLFNIKSNSESYKNAAMLVGDVSERKLWNILSAGMHPLLLMKYMTSMGLVKDVFRDGLKLYFPDGYKLEVDTSESYDEATAEFVKYTKITTGQMYRIPMSEENYFLCDMIYIDHVARGKSPPVNVAPSVCFDDAAVGKKVRMSSATLPMGLHDRMRLMTVEEDESDATMELDIDREETKATLEGYPEYHSPATPTNRAQGFSMFSMGPGAAKYGEVTGGYADYVQGKGLPNPLEAKQSDSHPLVRNSSMEVMAPTVWDKRHYSQSQAVTRPRMQERDVAVVPVDRYDGKLARNFASQAWPGSGWTGPIANNQNARFDVPTFHPEYPRIHQRQMSAPVVPTYVRPKTPTFVDCYRPIDIESCEDKLVFPYSEVSAKPENYARPDGAERDSVYDMINGRLRISSFSRRSRDKNFLALVRVWNMTVVDSQQFEGRVERVGVASYSSRSRRGTRYDMDKLIILFNAFKTYGLKVCVEDMELPIKGHVLTVDVVRTSMVKYSLSKVMLSKEPSVKIDWPSATRSAAILGAGRVAGACDSLIEDRVLDCVVNDHMPRLRQVSALGQSIGYAYDYDGAVVTMGHVIGRELTRNDLVKLNGKSTSEKMVETISGKVALRIPEIGEWLFIVVGFPDVVPSFVVRHGGMRFGMVGPLEVKALDLARGVCTCKGYSKPGLSGSPVVSGINGNLVGLLWGENTQNKDIAVSLL